MSSNEKEASSIALAPTLLDPSGETAVSNLPVTVVGPTLHFSGASGSARSFEENAFAERYESSSLLGEGGMGEVRLAQDARIGREVAMKVIRLAHAARDDFRVRFLREVRIQGQLEHPSIVPVYDLGIGADGATYFTMKRVRGLTLAEIFDRLRVKDPLAISQFSRRKLLAAFQNVCLALEFAHARGVIHRDLKPANVMLGDFGRSTCSIGEAFGPARCRSLPNVCELDERVTLGFLSIASVFLLLVCSISIRRIRNALTAAEERLSVQAWQLRQLVPEQARRRLD